MGSQADYFGRCRTFSKFNYFLIMENEKKHRGRPRRQYETIQIGCRIERVIYDEIKRRNPKVNMTQYINNVLRKELGL